MILNRPLLYDLTNGDNARIPQDSDNEIFVPATILPVAFTARPFKAVISSTEVLEQSGIRFFSKTSTNVAASSEVVMTLAAGLWELDLVLANWINFNNVAAAFSSSVLRVNNTLFSVNIISRLASINSFVDSLKARFLLDRTWTVEIAHSLTGVGQTLESMVSVNAVRIL